VLHIYIWFLFTSFVGSMVLTFERNGIKSTTMSLVINHDKSCVFFFFWQLSNVLRKIC